MRHSKFGLRAFGVVIVAALGLMAFTAVAAQAKNLGDGGVAGKFRVAGSSALAVGVEFTGKQEKLGANEHGLLLVPGRNLTILCETGEVTKGVVTSESEATAEVLFKKCVAWNLALSEKLACVIPEEMVTAKGSGAAKLHESELYILLAGAPFATVTLEGEFCPLPKTNAVSGSTVALVVAGSTEAKVHLISLSETIQLLFQEREGEVPTGKFLKGDRLLFGAFDAYVDANANLELKGTHAGKLWSVI